MQTKQMAPKTIDEYIANFPLDVQTILAKVRNTVRQAAPEAREAIKYEMPTFVQAGNLVSFAAWKNHIGFYGASIEDAQLKEALAIYTGEKGSLKFPFDQPIPYDLISEVVKVSVKEDLKRAEAKAKRKKGQ